MRQPLTKEAENRIASGLNKVIDLVNGGAAPSDAIVKVATELQLPAGHVPLMVNAYNIGRSEAQRKGSADLFEKVSEFELADASQVLERMFPTTVKSAGVLAEEWAVSPAYMAPPRFLQDRAKREKLAAAEKAINWDMVPVKPAPLPRDPATAVKKAHSKLVDGKRALEEARRAAQHFYDKGTDLVEKLATWLKQPGAPLFDTVRADARIMFGEPADRLFAHMATGHKALTKQASAGRTDAQKGSILNAVKLVLDTADSFERAKAHYEKVSAAHDAAAAETVRPFLPAAPEHGSVLGPSSDEKRAFLGGLFGSAVGANVGKAVGDKLVKPTEALQSSMQKKLTDPQHEATLRNIQTEAMLTDLMANDDVISGYPSQDVVNNFNEISQLSPRATNQSGLMRALLRKRLQQGALDPYEVDMLLKIENSLKTRDNPSPGGVLNGSGSVV